MPTYEYACKACEHRFEIVQSFSEDALTTCPECDRDELRKVYNAAGIIFKGDGWHIKDYAKTTSGSPASSGAASSGSDSSSSSSGDGSSSGDAAPKAEKKTKDKGSSSSDSTSKPAAG